MTVLIGYEWRLREQMAAAGMFSTTKLIPLLEERGVHLSSSQVYRLVAERPERLNLQVLVVLMDILNCTADDLIVKADLGHARNTGTADDLIVKADLGHARNTGTAEAAGTDSASTVIRTRGLRPHRARLSD